MIKQYLIFLFVFFGINGQTQEFNEELLDHKLSKLSDKQQVKFFDSLANSYHIEDNVSGIKQIDFLITYAKKKSLQTSVLASLFYYRGALHRKQGEYVNAVNDFRQSENIYRKNNDLKGLSSVYSGFSNLYFVIGDNIRAINYNHQSIKLAEKLKSADGLGVGYNSLANIYLSLKNYDSTLFYYKKSFNQYRGKNAAYQRALLLDNISMVYVERSIADSAYIYSKLAREEAKPIKDAYLELQLLLNAAGIEELLGHYDLQLEISERASFLADSLQVPIYKTYTAANLASAYFKNKKYAAALKIFNAIIPEAKALNTPSFLKEVYLNLSEIHEAIHQSDSAFRYFKLSVAMQDSIDQQTAADKVNELIARNQLENKENKIKHEQELRLAEKSKFETEKASLEETQKWQFWIIVISILAVIVTVILIIIINKRLVENRKLNALMKEKNVEIIEKNKSLHESKQEIISSINYAKRIQFALLAHEELLKSNLPEHFVYFKPKDIVSGDFYWGTFVKGSVPEGEDRFYLAVCDSTGHGVPGAFMSLLNISFLNEAINEKNIMQPHDVLNHVKQRLIQNMEGAKDGMDAVLMQFSKGSSGSKVRYAAAHNHPVLIRNGQLTELAADKLPVGLYETNESFTGYEVEVQKGDLLFLFTDGYADQFGGERNKKFKKVNLHQLLANNASKTLPEIKKSLEETLQSWKGQNEQVDDICIIGIRI